MAVGALSLVGVADGALPAGRWLATLGWIGLACGGAAASYAMRRQADRGRFVAAVGRGEVDGFRVDERAGLLVRAVRPPGTARATRNSPAARELLRCSFCTNVIEPGQSSPCAKCVDVVHAGCVEGDTEIYHSVPGDGIYR